MIFFLVLLIPISILGVYILSLLTGKRKLEAIPFVALWFVGSGVGLLVSLTVYHFSITIFHSPYPFLILFLCFLLSLSWRRFSFSVDLKKEVPCFVVVGILIFIFQGVHEKIGVGHIETHAPIAAAIKSGNLPVMNTADYQSIGIDKHKVDKEIARFTSSKEAYFPILQLPVEKPLAPYHYLHPTMLSLLRVLTFDMPYPMLQLFELTLLKIIIFSSIFSFFYFETKKLIIALSGTVIFCFSGSWLFLKAYINSSNNMEDLSLSMYRMTYGNGISFGYPLTLIQNPDIVLDLMVILLCVIASYCTFKYKQKMAVFFFLLPLMVFILKGGSGYGLISGMMIIFSIYLYQKILPEKWSDHIVVLFTGAFILVVGLICVKGTVPIMNTLLSGDMQLMPKEGYYFAMWEWVKYYLTDVDSWWMLFLQTGNIMLFIPFVLLFAKGRNSVGLSHSLLIATIPLIFLSIGFTFKGIFPRPDWTMTRFWTLAFLYCNMAIAFVWSEWVTKSMTSSLLKIVVTAPLVLTVVVHFVFLYNLSSFAGVIETGGIFTQLCGYGD